MTRSVVLTVLLLLPAATAEAQDEKARARALIDRGNSALREAKYTVALDAYREAFAVYPSPKIRLNIAEVHNQLGQFVAAIEQYEAYLDETEGQTELGRAAASRRDKLLQKIGRVEVIGAQGTKVLLDGKAVGEVPVKLRLDPGEHQIRALRDGYQPFQTTTAVAPGSKETITLEMLPAIAEPPPPEPAIVTQKTVEPDDGGIVTKWWFWTAIGVAVVGGVTAGVLIANSGGDDRLPEGELGSFSTGTWESF